MLGLRLCFIAFVLFACFRPFQCGRYNSRGGGSRGTSSGGYRPRPSPPPRTYNTPSRSHPPTYRPTSPPIRTTPRPNIYQPPRSTQRPYQPPIQTSRTPTQQNANNGGFNQPVRSTPRPQRPIQTSRAPIQQNAGGARPPYQPNQFGSTRRPGQFGTTRRPAHMTTPRSSWGGLPPRPGSAAVGPPHYQSGPQKVKIVNKYNYHYPGYYSMPVHYSHPGYYYTPSYYSYGTHDTGSTALGFFLGYSLAKITTPTYSHYSFYDGYRPRYDHYEVHHYYHNKESVPQYQEIRSNTIVGCVGDSSSVCPGNTVSLCTSNGALMCVASATSTVPCEHNRQVNCVQSTISCENNQAPECQNGNQKTATISIPCVSKAEVKGEVKFINNTIVPANATNVGIPPPPPVNATIAANNTTITANGTTEAAPITQYTIPDVATTAKPVLSRRKRQASQNYCVTVLAVPSKRAPTEGELFLSDAKYLAEVFVENAWDL